MSNTNDDLNAFIKLSKELGDKLVEQRTNLQETISAIDEDIVEHESLLDALKDTRKTFREQLVDLERAMTLSGHKLDNPTPMVSVQQNPPKAVDKKVTPQNFMKTVPEFTGPVPDWGDRLSLKTLTILHALHNSARGVTIGQFRTLLRSEIPGIVTGVGDQLAVRLAGYYRRGYVTRSQQSQSGGYRYKTAPGITFD